MRAFITGATGFLGSYIACTLLARGWEVSALVRTMDKMRALPKGVRGVPGNIVQRESLRSAMAGADVVFHAAALYEIGVTDAAQMRQINVEGTRNVLELAFELGVPKIVYTSTVAVYGPTHGRLVDETYRANGAHFASEYERTKYAAHYQVARPLQDRGAPLVIVCPGQIYGPGDTSQFGAAVRLYTRGLLPVMIGGETALTWAHAQDVADGHWLAYEKGRVGETYILAGPPHTFREFFEMCERVSGLRAPLVWLPGEWAAAMARALRPLGLAGVLSAEMMQSVADITYLAKADKAKRELGWSPLDLEAGLAEYLKWMSGSTERAG